MSRKVKKIIYWSIIAILIAVILVSVGMIAHKLITDARAQNAWDDLANDKNALAGTRPSIPTGSVTTTPTAPPDVTNPTTPSILPEYAASYALNNDMVGWIQIPGTQVDYPVVQSKYQANYYLRRNFQKEYSDSGTIYAREACDVNKPSDNVVLYGHNMTTGIMFHDLIKYKKQSFWEENRYIYFDTLTEYRTYEIFAVFVTTADPRIGFRYHIFHEASGSEDFDDYVATAKSLAYYDTGIIPQYGDKLLTLSTCDRTIGYGGDGRLVVMARRVV